MFVRVLSTLSLAGLLAAAAVPPPAAGRGLTEQEIWSTRGGANGQCCGPTDLCKSYNLGPGGVPPGCPNGLGCAGGWGERKSAGETCVAGAAGDHCETAGEPGLCRIKKICSKVNGVCQAVDGGSDSVAACGQLTAECALKP